MSLLKCGFIIPELNDYLEEKGVNSDVLMQYYKKNSYFQLIDNQNVEYETVESLTCVAYNLISRGYPTQSSLKIAKTLLQNNLPEDSEFVTICGHENLQVTINNFLGDLSNEGESEKYQALFKNWNESGLSYASSQLGLQGFRLFSIFEDLRATAFIQKALLFCVFANLHENKISVFIDLEKKGLSSIIVEDMNDLLSSLAVLADKNVPVIVNSSSHQQADVIIGTSWGKFSNYNQFNKPYLFINAFPDVFGETEVSEDNVPKANVTFLSAPKINYSDLGISIENEDQDISEFKFHDLKKKEALKYLLNNIFRKKEFRAGQLAIINRGLQNRDVIGLLPTGGGKSLCFQLCGLMQPGLNIVVDPINSLMKDQFVKLCDYNIGNAGFINSLNNIESDEEGLTVNESTLNRFENGELLFLFISPERLVIDKFRKALTQCTRQQNEIHYCIIDEAHCVSEWGHDFRIPYLRLADNLRRFCSSVNNVPTLFALTATASYDVLSDIQREMNLQADSIITLPPASINRKELSYNIVDLSATAITTDSYPKRERELSIPKLKILNDLFLELPSAITKISTKSILLDDQFRNSFYKEESGTYKNAGIIFCSTRSNKLQGGVVSLFNKINSTYDFLKAGTYFSPTDSETVLDGVVDETALNSIENQKKFLDNKLNLMICTKSFGMGIDKPNIRYTIHYALPSSIESFYQESGRAGRDRKKAICSLLYHPADELTALDFLEKSFRGVAKEMIILEELLTEVKYEPRFFLYKLEDYLRSELNYGFRLKFYPREDPSFIYINGAYTRVRADEQCFGAVRLTNLSHLGNAVQNVSSEKVTEVLNSIRAFFSMEVPDGNYKRWITQTKTDGIRTLLNKQIKLTDNHFQIQVGFSNDGIDEIEKLLKPVWNKITPRVIKAGYSFAQNPNMFIENLTYRYAQHLENERQVDARQRGEPANPRYISDVIRELPHLPANIISDLKGLFYRLRLVNDTQRAIYRLIQVGILDDYEMDYAHECATIYFSKKDPQSYIKALKIYLRRYLGKNSIETYVNKYKNDGYDDFLKPLKIITDFFQNEVKEKRIRGLKLMKDLCELAIVKGEDEFKENIVLYFTSKYAKPEYLPADLDEGKIENFFCIAKYIEYLSAPPDELGSEKDNARHLFGACNRLRIGIGSQNHTLNILNAFAFLCLADHRILENERRKLNAIVKEFAEAVDFFGNQIGWNETLKMVGLFQNKSVNINTETEGLLNTTISEIIEERIINLTYQLNKTLNPA